MKKQPRLLLLTTVLLTAVLVTAAGCTPIPEATKGALYSAQLTLKATVDDSDAAATDPWAVPAGEAASVRCTRLQAQVDILKAACRQSEKNLAAVVGWFRTGEEAGAGQ